MIQRATLQRTRTRRMSLAAGISLLVHGAVLLAILWRPVVPAPLQPLNQPTVQVLLTKGQGNHRTRGGQAARPAPATKPPAIHQPAPARSPPTIAKAPAPAPPPPMPQPPRTVAVAPPPPPPPRPKPAAKPATLPRPTVTAAPARRSLPMEFGSLGGPSVVVQKKNKSVVTTTQPDQGNLAPTYPPAAYRRGEAGTVALWVYVAADGFVDRVKVVKSSGYPLLDQAAVARLRNWHFTPATQGGNPVPSIYKIAVTFGP